MAVFLPARYLANIPSVMTDLSLTSIVCHTPAPVSADVAGETVLMSLERSRCYGLGSIGSEIWSKLVSPVRVADLIEEFSGALRGSSWCHRARCPALAEAIGGRRTNQSRLKFS